MNKNSEKLTIEEAKEKQLEIFELLKALAKQSDGTMTMSQIKQIEKSLNDSCKLKELMNYYCHPHLWGGWVQPIESLKKVMGNRIEYSTDPNKAWGNWLQTLRYIQDNLLKYLSIINKIKYENSFPAIFDKYFQRLVSLYNREFRTKPTTVYCEGWNSDIIISEKDADGYHTWKPYPQIQKPDINQIESDFGFKLKQNIKDFFTTYSFSRFGGTISTDKFENININFFGVNFEKPTIDCILQSHKDGSYYFENSQIFVVGDTCINDNDGYLLFYDNKKDSLFCINTTLFEESNHTKKTKIQLGGFLTVLSEMKPTI